MTRTTISRVESKEGLVRLYSSVYDDGTTGYDVIKATSSFKTSKSIHGLRKLETACKRYNKYTTELAQEYARKFA